MVDIPHISGLEPGDDIQSRYQISNTVPLTKTKIYQLLYSSTFRTRSPSSSCSRLALSQDKSAFNKRRQKSPLTRAAIQAPQSRPPCNSQKNARSKLPSSRKGKISSVPLVCRVHPHEETQEARKKRSFTLKRATYLERQPWAGRAAETYSQR